MALLTNEQINDILDITNVCEDALIDEICEWNEKQTTQQVAIDWNDAPKYATKAVLRMHWVTESEGSELLSSAFESVTFERPKPIITPHPHAEIIMKYAEVAQRRVDPWVEFEWTNGVTGSEVWVLCDKAIGFGYGVRYRHIGDDK